MSGHSKWANIKRKKGVEDKKRSQVFSKLSRAIAAAIKEGGSANPGINSRLRMVLQQAKVANMPKDNIKRALERGEKQEENLESFVLEGYGLGGVAVMVEALSNNRQRTVQELKSLFRRHGGNLAEPGSVAFQFEQVGAARVSLVSEKEALRLMDLNVSDFKQEKDGIVFYLPINNLEQFKKTVVEKGMSVVSWGLIMKAKNTIQLDDKEKRGQVDTFLAELNEHDDVQRVFTNLQ